MSPIRDANGRPERLLALSRDVTELKKNEIALRRAVQFNQEIMEGAEEGIIVYDPELRYQLWNPFMERLTGKRAKDVLGKVASEAFPHLLANGIESALKRALSGEVVHIADVLVSKHSAEGEDVWESCTFGPHRDAQGSIVGVIGMVRNVTDRHIAEETFRSIVVGTAAVTGDDFFASLVRHMASRISRSLCVCHVLRRPKARPNACLLEWRPFGDNFEFDIADTPCMKVLRGEVCLYEEKLQDLFPLDKGLRGLGCGKLPRCADGGSNRTRHRSHFRS